MSTEEMTPENRRRNLRIVSDNVDPEVIADLKLRAYTEHDRSRTRSPVGALGSSAGPEPIVAQWECRNPACKALVGVTQTAVDTLAQFNGDAYEKVREGRRIKESTCVACDACLAMLAEARAKAQETRRHDLSLAIKELKDKKNPRDAVETLAKLKKLKHPALPELIDAIETRQKLPSARRSSKGDV